MSTTGSFHSIFLAIVFLCYKTPNHRIAPNVLQWVVRYGVLVVKTKAHAEANLVCAPELAAFILRPGRLALMLGAPPSGVSKASLASELTSGEGASMLDWVASSNRRYELGAQEE
eukprot:1160067-Pelagomonas_calceolata.AAC.3